MILSTRSIDLYIIHLYDLPEFQSCALTLTETLENHNHNFWGNAFVSKSQLSWFQSTEVSGCSSQWAMGEWACLANSRFFVCRLVVRWCKPTASHSYTMTDWPTTFQIFPVLQNVCVQAAGPRDIGGAVVWGPEDPALGVGSFDP